jgi:acyl dehydratase
MSLAERVFTETDQKRFASVSGDYNPMHMDALQARRTQAGAPVVHGINLFLWALPSCLRCAAFVFTSTNLFM